MLKSNVKCKLLNVALPKRAGFTLIEVIIYSTLVAIIIAYSLGGVYSLIESSEKLNNKAVIDEEANFIIKKFDWALGSLQTINTPASGGTGSSLSINRYNFSSNPLIFNFDIGNLTLKVGDGQPVALNNDRVQITNLVFEHIAATSLRPPGIRISMNINNRPYATTIYQSK